MKSVAVAVFAVALVACATGPRRQSLPEFIQSPATPEPSEPIGLAQDSEPASPFSAGLMLGAGILLESGQVLPAQLAVGSLKVTEVRGQALNLLALGGVGQTDVSSARLSWGLGAGFQVTPERYAYEVDGACGVLWLKGEPSPAFLLGFVLTPKM